MNVSRRFLIGGLGAFAFGLNRIFAAKAVAPEFPKEAKPLEADA